MAMIGIDLGTSNWTAQLSAFLLQKIREDARPSSVSRSRRRSSRCLPTSPTISARQTRDACGIESRDVWIACNTPILVKHTETFTTAADLHQRSVRQAATICGPLFGRSIPADDEVERVRGEETRALHHDSEYGGAAPPRDRDQSRLGELLPGPPVRPRERSPPSDARARGRAARGERSVGLELAFE